MLSRIDHVIVAVSDLAAAADDYRAVLGRESAWRGAHPGAGTANVLFRLDNGYLELLGAEGEGAVGDALRSHLARFGEGPFGFALECESAEACVETLRSRGWHPTAPVEGSGRDAQTGAERRWRNVFLPSNETRGVNVFAIEHLSPRDALPPSPAVGSEAAAVREFDHLVVMTRDADGAKRLYGDAFGIRLALDETFEKFGSRLVFFRLGGVSIEIGASLKEEPDPAEPDRFWGLAFRVPDVEAGRARIADLGLDVSEVRKGRKEGTRVCTVRSGTHGVATLLIGPDAERERRR